MKRQFSSWGRLLLKCRRVVTTSWESRASVGECLLPPSNISSFHIAQRWLPASGGTNQCSLREKEVTTQQQKHTLRRMRVSADRQDSLSLCSFLKFSFVFCPLVSSSSWRLQTFPFPSLNIPVSLLLTLCLIALLTSLLLRLLPRPLRSVRRTWNQTTENNLSGEAGQPAH